LTVKHEDNEKEFEQTNLDTLEKEVCKHGRQSKFHISLKQNEIY